MNNQSQITTFLLLFIICIYSLLLYTLLTHQYELDFASFYSAIQATIKGKNPYGPLVTSYFPETKVLVPNLNPPFVLWFFNPLGHSNYQTALAIWSISSLILGLIGAGIAFSYAFSAKFLEKNRLNLYLVYLSLFSTLMNTSVVQMGSFLLFFTMLGYHFYLTNRNYFAGVLWGVIIAFKFFPALLFFYVLKQGRLKVFYIMLATSLIACLIPLIVYGPTLYLQYYSMFTSVYWYGDSWNASIYGFIYRLLIDNYDSNKNLQLITTLYTISFVILVLGYYIKLRTSEINRVNHQPFCLTVVMMLLLSPMGWLYYFPLLIFPLALTWARAMEEKAPLAKTILLWITCLFLINFPTTSVMTKQMTTYADRLGFSSFYFYGLLLLAYLVMIKENDPGKNELIIDDTKRNFILATLIILAFGLMVPSSGFFMRLATL